MVMVYPLWLFDKGDIAESEGRPFPILHDAYTTFSPSRRFCGKSTKNVQQAKCFSAENQKEGLTSLPVTTPPNQVSVENMPAPRQTPQTTSAINSVNLA
jgi:hypothetical protein